VQESAAKILIAHRNFRSVIEDFGRLSKISAKLFWLVHAQRAAAPRLICLSFLKVPTSALSKFLSKNVATTEQMLAADRVLKDTAVG
jgi:hypothetical protein